MGMQETFRLFAGARMFALLRISAALVCALAVASACAGCGSTDRPGDPPAVPPTAQTSAPAQGGEADVPGHSGAGWWCDEHGIPEGECSMCNSQVAAELRGKGDWCDKHDRAKSQCFVCDPKLKEKFASLFRAKFGKEPPPPAPEPGAEPQSGTTGKNG